jgi:D-glycero-alpha-D-manno-heptose-7-phosphate kinase
VIITRTPYRLSLFGGGTDYNDWFESHGGRILAAAMRHYCYLTVRKLPPFFEHTMRIVYSKIESVNNVADIEHPSVKGCLQYLGITHGMEIHHDGDLPARSGIGSSSSFTVGLLQALHALDGRRITPETLAREAIHVEQNILGESVGIQDQIMAAHGGLRVTDMGPGKAWDARPVVVPPEYLQTFESHVLLGYSGISRFSGDHSTKKVANIRSGKTNHELEEISALADQAIEAFETTCDFDCLGGLLNTSWQLKRRLADGVSSEWMDALYSTAISAGAFGGKFMGAGGGGFFFFLAPPERHQAIKDALPNVRVWVPFNVERRGSQVLFFNE